METSNQKYLELNDKKIIMMKNMIDTLKHKEDLTISEIFSVTVGFLHHLIWCIEEYKEYREVQELLENYPNFYSEISKAFKRIDFPHSHEPNDETLQTFEDTDKGIGLTYYENTDELFKMIK